MTPTDRPWGSRPGPVAAGARIRVLFVVLEMDLGGLQRVVSLLIRRLDPGRFTPLLCCLDRAGAFCEGLDPVRVKTVALGRRPGPFDVRLFRKLCTIVARERIDVIHSQNGCTLYAALAAVLTRRKIVHTDHGRLIPDTRAAILEDRFCSYVIDRFVGVSTELTEYLGTTVGVSRKKLLTIINGVDTDRFRPAPPERRAAGRRALGIGESDLVLGTVCRLEPVKNLDFMMRGFASLLRAQPGIRLVIVGDGPDRQRLERQIAAAGLGEAVTLLGRRDDVESLLPLLDAYVCTSLSEGTSMTILEAMSCGLPVVASDVGGNRSLVAAATGALFPSQDETAFVSACLDILSSPAGRSRRGDAGRREAEARYSLGRCVREYENLYLTVVGGG